MKKISKILISNRGEIAVRAIKTCQKLGIKTVAVYSDVDASFPFVQMADESYHIGLPPAKESYLNMQKIINVAKQAGADAIYPGYGFLSENSEFIAKLVKEGIIFVGPNAEAVRMMGDKITSKIIAKKAGINTIPGCDDVIKDANHAKEIAKQIGFPVMLKASAGGGGKGIRIVKKEEEIEQSLTSVINEAEKSFGDGRIFMEKFIENPRHIEIQVIADKHGNIVCLGERECSIQRNNQKVLEEAPSSFVTEEVRQEMYKQSVQLAKTVGYDSAGTLEFVMDANRNFYFLEMNTRLQVEHPVTEYITGLDLIEQMIYSAEGRKLEFTQSDIKLNGWAIESRICAEDPSKNFLPSVGRISTYLQPKESTNVRVDTGIREGLSITPYYDSMIAKLITYGTTREEARTRMMHALNQFVIEGLDSNITFLQAIYSNPNFISGDFSTAFIKKEYVGGFTGSLELNEDASKMFAFAACVMHLETSAKLAYLQNCSGQKNYNYSSLTDFVLFIETARINIKILSKDGARIHVEINNIKYEFTYSYKRGNKLMQIIFDDKTHFVKVLNKRSSFVFEYNGAKKAGIMRNARTAALYEICINNATTVAFHKEFECPITGVAVGVFVKEGDFVAAGTLLFTIEAMKMENAFYAEHDGIIEKVLIAPMQNVNMGDILLRFKQKD